MQGTASPTSSQTSARRKVTWRWGDLAFEVRGQGAPVVFLHGFAGAREQWERFLDSVAAWGFRVYAVDLPGHGESPKPTAAEAYRPEVWVAALAQWHQRHVGEPAWWVGHSLGGGLIVALARTQPECVRGGLLLAPYLHRCQWRRWLTGIAPAMPLFALPARYPDWLSPWFRLVWRGHPDYRNAPPQLRHARVRELLHMSPRAWHTVAAMREPFAPRPPGHWLLMGGPGDTILRYSTFVTLARTWDIPLQTLPGARHMLHVSHPEDVLATLETLLRRIPPASARNT